MELLTHFYVNLSIFSAIKINIKIAEENQISMKYFLMFDSCWVPVGSGSGFKNSELLYPGPAENGPDPQPWVQVPVPR